MAKKKSVSPATKETPAKAGDRQVDLAAPVSASVRIHNVVLASCEARRSPETGFSPKHTSLDVSVSEIEIGVDAENNRFYVKPEFTLKTLRSDLPEAEPSLVIKASFALVYSVESVERFSEESLHAFAETNGVFNAWPYWREFAQNTASRMGLPGIMIPLFRVSAPQAD